MASDYRFARWVFRIAGGYGLIVIIAAYFSEASVNRDYPPAITHREYFYGFMGVTLAWQLAFLVISMDPARFRPLMLVAVVEKLGFFLPGVILWLRGVLPPPLVAGAPIDFVLGVLFAVSYARTVPREGESHRMIAP